MRVVLCGQKRFGRDTLALLLRLGHEIAAVSAPADPADKLRIAAANRDLSCVDSERFSAASMPSGCDLIIAAHCHSFLSAKTRSRTELGALGYHPSLLPRHRGRSAIEWTVRFGDKITGGTVYWLNDTVDGGPIAAQDFCHVRPGDTARELWARDLAPIGLRLFERALADLGRGVKVAMPQDTDLATWEPAIDRVPPLWRPDVPLLGCSRYRVATELQPTVTTAR